MLRVRKRTARSCRPTQSVASEVPNFLFIVRGTHNNSRGLSRLRVGPTPAAVRQSRGHQAAGASDQFCNSKHDRSPGSRRSRPTLQLTTRKGALFQETGCVHTPTSPSSPIGLEAPRGWKFSQTRAIFQNPCPYYTRCGTVPAKAPAKCTDKHLYSETKCEKTVCVKIRRKKHTTKGIRPLPNLEKA